MIKFLINFFPFDAIENENARTSDYDVSIHCYFGISTHHRVHTSPVDTAHCSSSLWAGKKLLYFFEINPKKSFLKGVYEEMPKHIKKVCMALENSYELSAALSTYIRNEAAGA